MNLRHLGILLAAGSLLSTLAGCTSVVGAQFDEAIAAPTECDLLDPQGADPRSFSQCNSGSTCAATEDLAHTTCAPLRTSGAVGDACAYANDCAPGLTCHLQLGCVPLCTAGATCDDGSECSLYVPEVTLQGRTFGFCLPPSCDPIDPRHPAEGLERCPSEQCRFIDDDRTACFTLRRYRRPTGVACEDDLDCDTTDACFEHTCRRLCRLGQKDCTIGQTCVEGASGLASPKLQGETYGHCETSE